MFRSYKALIAFVVFDFGLLALALLPAGCTCLY